MPDRRRSHRKKAFLAAYLVLEDRPAPVFCLVRDVSPQGARLELIEGGTSLPEAFVLSIGGRDRLYHAEVTWRQPNEVGVRFLAKVLGSQPAWSEAS